MSPMKGPPDESLWAFVRQNLPENCVVRLVVAALLLLLTSACATRAPQAYDPGLRDHVKRIGVLTPGFSNRLDVRLRVHPGDSFGIIGVLVGGSDMDRKSERFTAAIAEDGFKYEHFFRDHVVQSLQDAGYEVVAIPVGRRYDELAFLERYPVNEARVDAYLDLYAERLGYMATAGDTPYRPSALIAVRLLEANGGRVLFEDRIAYNALGEEDEAITISGSAEFEFTDFSDLIDCCPRAIEGLKQALAATGDELARQLR